MKILQLCIRIPYPPNDGGTIAMYNAAISLQKAKAQVNVLSFNTKKHFIPEQQINTEYAKAFNLKTVYLDADVKFVPALFNLFSHKSYNITRFVSKSFNDALIKLLKQQQFDIIQLESLFVTPYIEIIKKHSTAKVVLRAHNMEFLIWERLARSEKLFFKKWYLHLLSKRLKKYETKIIQQLDALVALTPDDAVGFKSLGFNKPILIAPIGVDVASYKTVDLQTKPVQFFHLGSMDWLPNEEAVSWLIQNVLPLLIKKGNVNISLAGKGMPQWIFNLSNPSLQIKGLVSDAKNYMSKRHVMLVPILSGSGMRVKILEGLATGNVIISTTIGAEGIKYTHMLNMIIADTPKQFADAMCLLLDNPLLIEKISIEAKKLAWQHYDNEGIGKSMIAFYSKLK